MVFNIEIIIIMANTKENKGTKGTKGAKTNKKESKNTEVGTKLLFTLTGGLLKGSTAYVSYTTDLTPEGVHTKFKDYYGPDVVVNFVESSSTKKHYDAFVKEMDEDSLVYSAKGTNPFSLYAAVPAKKVLATLSSASGVDNVSKFTVKKETKKKPASKKGAKKGDEDVNADSDAEGGDAGKSDDKGEDSPVSKKKPAGKKVAGKKDESDSGSDNDNDNDSGSDSDSGGGSASDSDSDSDDKKPTKKTSDKKK
jgi:hypothetical protein